VSFREVTKAYSVNTKVGKIKKSRWERAGTTAQQQQQKRLADKSSGASRWSQTTTEQEQSEKSAYQPISTRNAYLNAWPHHQSDPGAFNQVPRHARYQQRESQPISTTPASLTTVAISRKRKQAKAKK
jgi:hypothetical protein